MDEEINLYLQTKTLQHISEGSLKRIQSKLRVLQKFLQSQNKFLVNDVSEDDLQSFILEIKQRKSPRGDVLSSSTVGSYVSVLRQFFAFLKKRDLILLNPGKRLKRPKKAVKLPRSFFSENEIENIFRVINIQNKFGIRDRALLELLYSSALRSNEILSMSVGDIDFNRELIFVKHGKGRKERIVPAGKRALFWLGYYLEKTRRCFPCSNDTDTLFLSSKPGAMNNSHLNRRILLYKTKAGINKVGGAHSFRHSCATHMLRHGADIRYVQELLGHEQASTTVIYTKVSLNHLKEAYQKVF